MQGRSTSSSLCTFDVEVRALKAAARVAHAKLNDALVVAIANGLNRYHDAMGAPIERLRMGMAINNRFTERADRLGNEFVPARFESDRYRDRSSTCRAMRISFGRTVRADVSLM